MNIKEAFLAGYTYGFTTEHAWFGNTRDTTPDDEHVDNGILAARKDKNAGKQANAEAAWQEYSKTLAVPA